MKIGTGPGGWLMCLLALTLALLVAAVLGQWRWPHPVATAAVHAHTVARCGKRSVLGRCEQWTPRTAPAVVTSAPPDYGPAPGPNAP